MSVYAAEQFTFDDYVRRTHENSAHAYREEKPKLGKKAMAVLAHVRRYGGGTDREIAKAMGFQHRSAVQPRISELVEAGLLREVENIKCPVTGKTVRKVEA
ncbi:MAG TPA: helix-turn-helix domain-containing protein [Bryobacteraceae bacterium]|jgi:hypothetical protein